MPKGRGANARRRNERQQHPRNNEEAVLRGHTKLVELGVQAILVQKRRPKTIGTPSRNVARARDASDRARADRRRKRLRGLLG